MASGYSVFVNEPCRTQESVIPATASPPLRERGRASACRPADHDLAEVLRARQVIVRSARFVEGEHPIDDGPDAALFDGSDEALERRDGPDVDASNRLPPVENWVEIHLPRAPVSTPSMLIVPP